MMKRKTEVRPKIVRRAQRSAIFSSEGFNNFPGRNLQRHVTISNNVTGDVIKEEKFGNSSDSDKDSLTSKDDDDSKSENSRSIIRSRLVSEDATKGIKNKLEEARNLRESTLAEVFQKKAASGDLTLEDIIQKKQQITEKVDSFLAKSRIFSNHEIESDSEDEVKAFEEKERLLEAMRKLQEKAMNKYSTCKKQEKEMLGLTGSNLDTIIDFELVFGRRGQLKAQPTYSVNYSKYMTDPEEFKAEEAAKKRVHYYNHEEFATLERTLRGKLSGVSDETAIDTIASIYPQLSSIFESYIAFSTAFNYLFQNWKLIAGNPNPVKSLKNTRVPVLVTALLKEGGTTLATFEDQRDSSTQSSMKQEMDQVKEQLSEAETKIKEAQLKRLQKKLIGIKKEIDETKREKEVVVKECTERLERFISSIAFGQVFVTNYVEDIPYKKLVDSLKAQSSLPEEGVISELNDKLENSELTFQKVTACIDQEVLVLYEDPIEGRELTKLPVKNIEVTDFNLEYIDSDGPSILLLVAEINNPNSFSIDMPFFILKIKEVEIGKWAYAFGLQDYFSKKRVSRLRADSELSSPALRSSAGRRMSVEGGFLKPPGRDESKPPSITAPEETKSDLREDKHASAYEDLLFEPLIKKSKSEEREWEGSPKQSLRLSPSLKLSLAPINEEAEQLTVGNKVDNTPVQTTHHPVNKSDHQDEDSESLKNALETPLDDLIAEQASLRGTSQLVPLEETDERGEISLPRAQEILTSGFIFKKYGRRGQPHYRYVWLSGNKISWKDIESNSVCGSIPLTEIKNVIEGRTTAQFKRFPKVGKVEEASSFTIIGRKRTLDLEANEPKKKEKFVKALSVILVTLQQFSGMKKAQSIPA